MEDQRPASATVSCRGRTAVGYHNVLAVKVTPLGPAGTESEADGLQQEDMDLDAQASEFLNKNSRLDRLEGGEQMDLVEELGIEHGELMDAVDEHGGLQVKDGPYIPHLDFRSGNGSDDESSVEAGSEDLSAVSGSGCAESGSDSEPEPECDGC